MMKHSVAALAALAALGGGSLPTTIQATAFNKARPIGKSRYRFYGPVKGAGSKLAEAAARRRIGITTIR